MIPHDFPHIDCPRQVETPRTYYFRGPLPLKRRRWARTCVWLAIMATLAVLFALAERTILEVTSWLLR